MNRDEIMIPEYRAWDKKTKIFTNYQIVDNMLYFMNKFKGVWIRDDNQDRFVLMQSTGLKDKNGVEIFEGDILKTRTRGLVSVRKEKGNMMVTYKSGIKTRTSLTLSSFLDKFKVVVIGNIYENEELLK
ncbi:YopX family protein [Helcococcus ovis]|uniref:YopX family protein n=1 Tax=Helcococcus ovis TaxID=72026 RepID=UPI0038B8B2AC